MAQIGPPPLWPSSIPSRAAFRKLLGFHLRFLALSQASLDIRIERIVVVGYVLPTGLVIKELAEHVDQDHILPIGDPEAGRSRAVEYGTTRHPLEVLVIVLAADRAGFGHIGTEFADLVIKTP